MTIVNSQPQLVQAPSPPFAKRVKRRLVDLDLTITSLAAKISRSRTVTSIAINHATKRPAVKALIRKELGL